MNSVLRIAIDQFIAGKVTAAKRTIGSQYSAPLFEPSGHLTPFAARLAIGYPLRPTLRRSLRRALQDGQPVDCKPKALRIAQILRLVDESGHLTVEGRIRALEQLALRQQCQHLALPVEDLYLSPHLGRIEDAALDHFKNLGAVGWAFEGRPLLLLVQAICLDVLSEIHPDLGDLVMTGYLEGLVVEPGRADRVLQRTRATLLGAVANAQSGPVAQQLERLASVSPFLRNGAEPVTNWLLELFHALSRKQLGELTEFFLEEPYLHRSGWPDLILVRDGAVELVEVKFGNDRLQASQIRVIPRLREIIQETRVVSIG